MVTSFRFDHMTCENHIRIVGSGLELACNGGSIEKRLMSLACEKSRSHEPQLQASSSPIRAYENGLLSQ